MALPWGVAIVVLESRNGSRTKHQYNYHDGIQGAQPDSDRLIELRKKIDHHTGKEEVDK